MHKPPARDADADRVFETAAGLFGLLAAPVRLKILSALCERERDLAGLRADTGAAAASLAQHLGTLVRAGVVARRRDGARALYRMQGDAAATLCRAVRLQMALGAADSPARP